MLGQKIDVKFYEDHTTKIQFLMNFVNRYGKQLTPKVNDAIQDKMRQHILYLTALEQLQSQQVSQRGGNGKKPVTAGNPTESAGQVNEFAQSARSLT